MQLPSLRHYDGDYSAAPHRYQVWCGAAPREIAPVASRIVRAASHPTPYPELRLNQDFFTPLAMMS